MSVSWIDGAIVLIYLALTILIGFLLARYASKNIEAYFLGGNRIKWYFLGLSNASGMFDIAGTMWTVSILFVYGLKSAWLPWLWPVWNQVFVMVFLAVWMRRSNVMTGAEWILTRFSGRGGQMSHIVVVIFAVISTIGFMAYFFEGIGKFATSILPWDLSLQLAFINLTSAQSYALIIISITTFYTLKGGMFSVVAADVFQFLIMTVSCVIIAYIAYTSVTADQLSVAVPEGWKNLFFGWKLDLDWTGILDSVNAKIASDGFELFGAMVMMMIFKGIFASLAGPVPSYDMQRILSTRKPSDAAKMSGFTMLVLYVPRYLMVAGLAVLALVYLKPVLTGMGDQVDFEVVLPMAINQFLPVGVKGLLLAGLIAAFMGTFAAFVNSAPAYLVNDLYKKYIKPNGKPKEYVRMSYLASVTLVVIGVSFGFVAGSINTLTLWLTSSLYGGYAAANVLKWIWWRFNGYGYFWGMLSGLIASTGKLAFFGSVVDIWFFPVILAISFAGSILGSLLTPPDEEEVLMKFYKNVRPWGFWKPIHEKVKAANPGFQGNTDFTKDVFNVMVGIVWQMCLVVAPIFLIIKEHNSLMITIGVFIACSVVLKFTWYDNLKNIDKESSYVVHGENN
jgi:solute:Na+ symporter, SSS family